MSREPVCSGRAVRFTLCYFSGSFCFTSDPSEIIFPELRPLKIKPYIRRNGLLASAGCVTMFVTTMTMTSFIPWTMIWPCFKIMTYRFSCFERSTPVTLQSLCLPKASTYRMSAKYIPSSYQMRVVRTYRAERPQSVWRSLDYSTTRLKLYKSGKTYI